jgi:thiamine biosynthesis lipoprotein
MLKILGRRADFLILSVLILHFSNVEAQVNHPPVRFEFSHSSMGTLFTIAGYGSDSLLAKETASAAFSLIDRFNLIMSDYNPESELMQLCRRSVSSNYIPVSDELFHVLQESLYWSKWSDGIFDISIGPYSQLWRRAGRKDLMPDSAEFQKAAALVGYQNIKLDPANQSVLLTKSGMQLDLGGIAKGYTVDKIFNLFRNNGFDTVLVDGGGDIRVGEAPLDSHGWKIRIMNGDGQDSIAFLSNCAIATSGDLYRFTEINGIRYSHIINPFTGYGITIPRTVTVLAHTCTEADVLASILSISGPEDGFKILQRRKEVSAFIMENEKDKKKMFRYPCP